MNKREKAIVRQQIQAILDTHCAECPARRQSHYCLTQCPFGAQMQTLAKQLIQDETRQVKRTNEESDYIWYTLGKLPVETVAAKLNRSIRWVRTVIEILKEERGNAHDL